MRQITTSSSVSSQVIITQPTFLIKKMALLRRPYLWLQQSQNLSSVTMSKHKLFLPFAFSFDLFSRAR